MKRGSSALPGRAVVRKVLFDPAAQTGRDRLGIGDEGLYSAFGGAAWIGTPVVFESGPWEVSVMGCARIRSIVACLAVVAWATTAMVSTAVAQEAGGGEPDLGAGWVLRVQAAEGTGAATVAGTPELGYVAFLGGNEGWFSADGIDWQSIPFPVETGDFHVNDVAAGDLGFVAVFASPTTSSAQSLAFSTDGRSWTLIDGVDLPELSGTGGLAEVDAGPDGFVVTGRGRCEGFAWFSPDGRSWSRAGFPEECLNVRVAAHRDGWVAVVDLIDRGGVGWFTSDNGIDWTDRNATNTLDGLGPMVSYSGALVTVNVGPFRISVSNDDGISWEPGSVQASGDLVSNLMANDLGIVGSHFDETETGLVPGGLVFSPDGATWVDYPLDILLIDLAAAADSIVAVGPGGIFTWTPPGSELLPGAARSEPLARTGSNTMTLVVIAVGLLTVGTAVLIARRQIRIPSP